MSTNNSHTINSLAKNLFEYLYLRDKLSNADAVMGFGHFDEKIPLHCGTLYSKGFARFIIFSGGIGAGSMGLKKPEAQIFFDRLCMQFPEVPPEKIILEDQSTNTGENIQFTLSLLERNYSELLAINGFKKLIIVANAYRQRRVWLTCRKYLKDVELINSPPITSFENESEMFEIAGENLCSHLINELERIKTYPAKGFIENSKIPNEISLISRQLKKMINNG